MPIGFNLLLSAIGLDPGDVRLLRHQEKQAPGRSPYELWRDERSVFERYQARQDIRHRASFGAAKHRASFVATPDSGTSFVGIHRVGGHELLGVDTAKLHVRGMDLAGTCDIYAVSLSEHHHDLTGGLTIDWGAPRVWVQRADHQDKAAIEIRRAFSEPDFPGHQLKSRGPSDHRVSILEVAGSAASASDILPMEGVWKKKLRSREMGLNRN